jgi:hypothetical protein
MTTNEASQNNAYAVVLRDLRSRQAAGRRMGRWH